MCLVLVCGIVPVFGHCVALCYSSFPQRLGFSPCLLEIVIMGVTKELVETTLTTKLTPTHLLVIDTSGGCGASFDIEIASAAFEGKRLLERHRVVNAALTEELKEIHALSIRKALTPDQWKSQNPEKVSTETAATA